MHGAGLYAILSTKPVTRHDVKHTRATNKPEAYPTYNKSYINHCVLFFIEREYEKTHIKHAKNMKGCAKKRKRKRLILTKMQFDESRII